MAREARQRVAFRPGTRIGLIAASLAAAAALVLPTTALASTASIGSAQANQQCGYSADTVQSLSSGPSYTIPTGGASISAWSYQAQSGDTGSVNLLVWSLASAGRYTLVYVSPTVNLSDPNRTFSLPGPVSVAPGELLGLRISGPTSCVYGPLTAGDVVGFFMPEPPAPAAVGDTVSMAFVPGLQLNVAATVEVTPPAPNPVPTTADQCKDGGWQALTDNAQAPFKNQGDCVSFVATGGTNTAAGS